jgi:hypothetical protein
MIIAPPVDFLCPTGKGLPGFKGKIPHEMLKRREVWFAFAKVLKDAMGHRKAASCFRIRTIGNCDL